MTERLSPRPSLAGCLLLARGSTQLYKHFAASVRLGKKGKWTEVGAGQQAPGKPDIKMKNMKAIKQCPSSLYVLG